MDVEHVRGVCPRDAEQVVLRDVVGEHERGDVLGGRGDLLVAALGGELAALHQRVQQDLDVDLVVGAVDARGVVDGVGVDPPARPRVLDAAALGEPQVAALADDRDAQLGAVDADRVVALVARVGLRLVGGLDVGPDPAVPQQVDRRAQDRADQLGRVEPDVVRLDPEDGRDLLGDRDPLERARVHPAAGADERLVVVRPRRPRQLEEPPALGERGRGVRGGVEEDVAVVEGGHDAQVLGEQHAVAEHVAGHVADADDGDLVGRDVAAELAEVPAHRLPGAARGDAHGLVVVADRPARGERVAEPEPVVLRDAVRDVGERRGALVGGDDEVGVVGVVAHDPLGGAGGRGRGVPLPVVDEVEQAGDEHAVAGDALGALGVAVGRRRRRSRPAGA